MGLTVYLLRRFLRLAVSLLLVSAITFTLLQLAPGSFHDFSTLSANSTGVASMTTPEATDQLESRYGASIPGWQQYLIFMRGAVHWDLGPSYEYPQLNVQDIIASAFPVSATLAIVGILISLLIAVPIGVAAAMRKGSALDHVAMFGVTTLQALPNYLAGLVLTLIFSAGLHLLPTRGWSGPEDLILPGIALGVAPAGILARYVRSSVLETLQEDYVIATKAKGASRITLALRVLRNSLIPLVTVVGPLLAQLMVGTVFVETIFGVPGLGLYFANAAASRDMPLIMGTTLFFAFLVMVMNLLVDLSYGILDPRTRSALGIRRGRRPQLRPPAARVGEGDRWQSASTEV